MQNRLSPSTIVLLTIPPILWSANAIVGRMLAPLVPPLSLNFLRWLIAAIVLLPFATHIFKKGSGLWVHRKTYLILGLLGVGIYNAFQYLALRSSTPINVTLVASGMPIWMMLVGSWFFGAPLQGRQIWGALLSMAGVLVVMCRGEWAHLLELRLVPGDLLMILATIAWSFYSWLLSRKDTLGELHRQWAPFLLAQIMYGLLWSGLFAATEWQQFASYPAWTWNTFLAVFFIAIGPAIIAYRCWGAGVQKAGANIAGFFVNLTPLFTAILSSLILHEAPHLYHALAFLLIVGGIVISSVSVPRKEKH